MEPIFGRRNNHRSHPRQSSASGGPGQAPRPVQYDNVPAGSPIHVSSSMMVGNISPPTKNPKFTADGADLNIHTTQRSRPKRERVSYAVPTTPIPRPGSPHDSLVTVGTEDSFALSSESTDTISDSHSSFSAGKIRQSGSSSGQRSTSIHDSSRVLPPIPPSPPSHPSSSSVNLRPTLSSATRSDNRSSRYTAQTEPHSSHSHHHFPHLDRHGTMDDFNFHRPDDEEIEAMFQNIVRTRDLTNLPPLTIEQKWSMVERDERIRWKEEKAREEQARKVSEQSRTGMTEEGSPEWYLMKFMERSITPKEASRLLPSLRGHEVGWVQHFIAMQGTRALTQFISYISRKGKQRTEADHLLEYETLRCIKQILSSGTATQDVLTHNLLLTQIASSLNSPHLASRKLVVEVLTFLAYRFPEALNLVTGALETVSATNNIDIGNSPYAYWFASFERSISGRGRFGSLVGASEGVRKNAATESNINEYALSNIILINTIVENTEDLDLRIHHHSQMAAAGLHRIVELCRSFNFEQLNTQLDKLQDMIERDEKELRERLDLEFPIDLTHVEDLCAALKSRTYNTKAHGYLLSILQHLLLVRDDGPGIVQYYQLLDSLVTDVVMDHKLAGAEQRLGKSVESIITQFNDADQFRALEAEAAEMRADLRRLQLEKEALEREVMNGGGGLVGDLQGKIASLEKLQISRENTARLQTQLETQKLDYDDQITRLEAQITGLFHSR